MGVTVGVWWVSVLTEKFSSMNRIKVVSINDPIEHLISTQNFTILENSFAFCGTYVCVYVCRVLLPTHDLTSGSFLCLHTSTLMFFFFSCRFVLLCAGWKPCALLCMLGRDVVTESHPRPVSFLLRSPCSILSTLLWDSTGKNKACFRFYFKFSMSLAL